MIAVSALVIVPIVTSCIAAVAGIVAAWIGRSSKNKLSMEHGEVVAALELISRRIDDIGHNVGALRDQFVAHQQHHLDVAERELHQQRGNAND